jgi:hypothetical protein
MEVDSGYYLLKNALKNGKRARTLEKMSAGARKRMKMGGGGSKWAKAIGDGWEG